MADSYLPVKNPNTSNNVSITDNLVDQNGVCVSQKIPSTNPAFYYVKQDLETLQFLLKKYDITTMQNSQLFTSNSTIDHHVIYPGNSNFYFNQYNGANKSFDLSRFDLSTQSVSNITNTNIVSESFVECSTQYAIFLSYDSTISPSQVSYCLLNTQTNSSVTFLTSSNYVKGLNISGDKVVWCDDRNGNYDIFMYDASSNTTTTVCNNSADQDEPDISGDFIVWTDHRNDYSNDNPNANPPILDHDYGDIFAYKISTSTVFPVDTTVGKTTLAPSISGTNVAYHMSQCGSINQIATIMLANLSSSTITPIAVSTQLSHKSVPFVSNDLVIWQDYRLGQDDYVNIYGYSIQNDEEVRLTNQVGRDSPLSISYPYIIYNHKATPAEPASAKTGELRLITVQ